jgi:ABC-type antimicrobial peptide transport system permease subunit
LVKGDAASALSQPNNILLSEKAAAKYFPNEDPMGKTVKLDNETDYVVAGILADVPENSTFRFDFLAPLDNYVKNNEWLTTWESNGIQTYFMTQPGISAAAMTDKIKQVVATNGNQKNVELLAHPMPDWYLRHDFKDGKYQGGGRIESVRMFGIIALFILLIACINFMNLSTARSATRALEVGVRKVSGASRGLLASQFLSESLVVTVLAGILGIALASMILPYFNRLFSLQLSLNSAGMVFWAGMAGVVLLTGLLAGSYPALFLSGFQPVKVLKGLVKTGGSAVQLRKALVTAQFVISIFLIISTLVVYRQLEFIKNKNLGYDKENLVYMPVNGTLWDKYDALKADFHQWPGAFLGQQHFQRELARQRP